MAYDFEIETCVTEVHIKSVAGSSAGADGGLAPGSQYRKLLFSNDHPPDVRVCVLGESAQFHERKHVMLELVTWERE